MSDLGNQVGTQSRAGITCFSNIQVWLTRPAAYKKSQQLYFGYTNIMFRPNLDQFKGAWGTPDQNKNYGWHKTDYRNVMSDCWLEVHSAIEQAKSGGGQGYKKF